MNTLGLTAGKNRASGRSPATRKTHRNTLRLKARKNVLQDVLPQQGKKHGNTLRLKAGKKRASGRFYEQQITRGVRRASNKTFFYLNMSMLIGTTRATTTAIAATFRDVTEVELRRIRKVDGKVAVCDVIRAVTGQGLGACSTVWRRMTETFPELQALCEQCKLK